MFLLAASFPNVVGFSGSKKVMFLVASMFSNHAQEKKIAGLDDHNFVAQQPPRVDHGHLPYG